MESNTNLLSNFSRIYLLHYLCEMVLMKYVLHLQIFSPKLLCRIFSNILWNSLLVFLYFPSYKPTQRRPDLIWRFNNSVWLNYLVVCLHTLNHFAPSSHKHFCHFRREAMRFRASHFPQWMENSNISRICCWKSKICGTRYIFSREISPVFRRHFTQSVRMFFQRLKYPQIDVPPKKLLIRIEWE